MKVLLLKLFYFFQKRATKKTIILPTLLLFFLSNLSAQEDAPNIQLKIETGFLIGVIPNLEHMGFLFRVEPKLKTSINTVIGLRIGIVQNSQLIKNADPRQFNIDEFGFFSNWLGDSGNRVLSFVPTLDYHFNKKSLRPYFETEFRPYLGAGIGYFFLTNKNPVTRIGTRDVLDVRVKNQIGMLLRGGLDFGKLILGLEVNYIRKAKIETPNGQIVGTLNNSYIALSFGYAIGFR